MRPRHKAYTSVAGTVDDVERAGLNRSSRTRNFGLENAIDVAPTHVEINCRYADLCQRTFWLRFLGPAAVVLPTVRLGQAVL